MSISGTFSVLFCLSRISLLIAYQFNNETYAWAKFQMHQNGITGLPLYSSVVDYHTGCSSICLRQHECWAYQTLKLQKGYECQTFKDWLDSSNFDPSIQVGIKYGSQYFDVLDGYDAIYGLAPVSERFLDKRPDIFYFGLYSNMSDNAAISKCMLECAKEPLCGAFVYHRREMYQPDFAGHCYGRKPGDVMVKLIDTISGTRIYH